MLEHWGLNLDDETFDKVFKSFDISNTGYISFRDFQTTLGHVMQPMQTRYFRAEREHRPTDQMQPTCEIKGCIRHPLGYYSLCILHMKEQK